MRRSVDPADEASAVQTFYSSNAEVQWTRFDRFARIEEYVLRRRKRAARIPPCAARLPPCCGRHGASSSRERRCSPSSCPESRHCAHSSKPLRVPVVFSTGGSSCVPAFSAANAC